MEQPTEPGIVILACGNPSRGDDAIGPLLLERLRSWLAGNETPLPVTCIDEFQLQPENALDLDGHHLALFIDASVSSPAPYQFSRLQPAVDPSYTTHAMSPAAVLHVHGQVGSGPAPSAWQLAIRGESFELGAEPTASAREHLAQAELLIRQLCTQAEEAAWRERVS